MRSDIVPGARFNDYELPDPTSTPRKLSELQGDDPPELRQAWTAGDYSRFHGWDNKAARRLVFEIGCEQ